MVAINFVGSHVGLERGISFATSTNDRSFLPLGEMSTTIALPGGEDTIIIDTTLSFTCCSHCERNSPTTQWVILYNRRICIGHRFLTRNYAFFLRDFSYLNPFSCLDIVGFIIIPLDNVVCFLVTSFWFCGHWYHLVK